MSRRYRQGVTALLAIDLSLHQRVVGLQSRSSSGILLRLGRAWAVDAARLPRTKRWVGTAPAETLLTLERTGFSADDQIWSAGPNEGGGTLVA
jgi:hypothetical protein